VVEGEGLREGVEWHPLGFIRVVTGHSAGVRFEIDKEDNRDRPSAGVASRRGEHSEQSHLRLPHFDAGLLDQLAYRGLLDRFVRVDETSGQRPAPFERLVATPDEQQLAGAADD
jgi:hypothetical protein